MDESSSSRARESRPRRRVIDDPQTAQFITFGCDRRRKLLNQDRCKRIVIHFLEEVRAEYQGLCLGFVIMPEHIHVLIRFRERGRLIPFKQEWKRRSSVALVEYFQKLHETVFKKIKETGELSKETEEETRKAIEDFKKLNA